MHRRPDLNERAGMAGQHQQLRRALFPRVSSDISQRPLFASLPTFTPGRAQREDARLTLRSNENGALSLTTWPQDFFPHPAWDRGLGGAWKKDAVFRLFQFLLRSPPPRRLRVGAGCPRKIDTLTTLTLLN